MLVNPILRESCAHDFSIDTLRSKVQSAELLPSRIVYARNSEPVITNTRKSHSSFFAAEELHPAFVEKIFKVLENHWDINQQNFTIEVAQFARYIAGDFFDWHHDQIPDNPENKIRVFTVVLMLSEESEFSGGEFQYLDYMNNEIIIDKFKKGDFIIFPSRLTHKVNIVQSGTRETLTSWLLSQPIIKLPKSVSLCDSKT